MRFRVTCATRPSYVSGMGTWDLGPFENDMAADFLGETGGSPQELTDVLCRCADASSEEYLDVDDGQSAIAVCELVALGFGYGNLEAAPSRARAIARQLGPNESLRLLAIRALGRVRDPERSEVASLSADEPAFDAQLDDLLRRLTAAGE